MSYPHFGDNAPETQEDHESAQGREGRRRDCVLSTHGGKSCTQSRHSCLQRWTVCKQGCRMYMKRWREATGICAGPESPLENFLNIWYWRGREEQTKVLVHPCSQIWLVDFHDIYHTNLDNAQDNTEHSLRMWGMKNQKRLLLRSAAMMCKISVFLSWDGRAPLALVPLHISATLHSC